MIDDNHSINHKTHNKNQVGLLMRHEYLAASTKVENKNLDTSYRILISNGFTYLPGRVAVEV